MNASARIITTYHLEMTHSDQAKLKPAPEDFETISVNPPNWKLNKRFYYTVGANWNWTDRYVWSDQRWKVHASKAETKI